MNKVLLASSALLALATAFPTYQSSEWSKWFAENSGDGESDHFPQPSEGIWRGDDDVPPQPHLAATNEAGEMRLLWHSPVDSPLSVRFGSSSDELDGIATSTVTTYTRDEMCGVPANLPGFWKDPGFIHNAVMTGLEPRTTYYYSYEVGSSGDFSAATYFRTPPAVGPSESVAIAMFGDLGEDDQLFTKWSYYTTDAMSREVEDGSLDSILHFGDISYSFGRGGLWEDFFEQIEPMAAHVPYMVSIGNHEELKLDSGGECGVPYDRRFFMPQDDRNGANHNNWFSYKQGPVHFSIISGEHDFFRGSEQHQWLEADLAGVDRSETPWLIVASHRPMYTVHSASHTERMREELEDLMIDHKVDIMIGGHYHNYERTCPVKHGQCVGSTKAESYYDNPDAPIYMVAGMAGAELKPKPISRGDDLPSVLYDRHLGYVRLFTSFDAENGYDLSMEFLYTDQDEEVIGDVFAIHKDL